MSLNSSSFLDLTIKVKIIIIIRRIRRKVRKEKEVEKGGIKWEEEEEKFSLLKIRRWGINRMMKIRKKLSEIQGKSGKTKRRRRKRGGEEKEEEKGLLTH